MGKKFVAVILFAALVICVLFTVKNLNGGKPSFKSVELIYENQGESRHYYNELSKNAKIAYTLVVPEIYKHTERIEIPKLNDEEFNALMYAVSYDNPDLICYGDKCETVSEGGKYYFIPSYAHSLIEHDALTAQLNTAVDRALAGIAEGADDFQKELYIHDYICSICKYKYDGDGNYRSTVYDVLVNGEAVCEGYARTAQLLMNKAGIESYLVVGDAENSDGETVGHMWNVVVINGERYYLDVTWDDIDSKEVNIDKCYLYFNLDEELISRDHYNLSPHTNGCNSVKYNYFNMRGALYSRYNDTVRAEIENGIVSNADKGQYSYEMMFTNSDAYNRMFEQFFGENEILEIMNRINSHNRKLNFKRVEYITFDNANYVRLIFS